MAIIWRQIEAGDYLLNDLPGERKIAADTGVSYMTARKAVLALIDKGMLTRQPNGKLQVHPDYARDRSRLDVAFLYPAYASDHLNQCRLIVTDVAKQHNVAIRPVQYVHWEDPIIINALAGGDGVLLMPSTEPMPAHVIERFVGELPRLVVFDGELSERGIPSIRLFPTAHIESLFEHVWQLGHRHIDFVNSQGHNEETERRIALWQAWAKRRDVVGRVWDDPAAPFTDPTPHAYHLAQRLMRRRKRAKGPTAVICSTQPAALATMRVCYEQGLRVGRDVSVATINSAAAGRYFCPSLTGLETPDLSSILKMVFDTFARGASDWQGPVLLEPTEPQLFEGESTGPAVKRRTLQRQ